MQAIVKMLVKCEVARYADNSFCCWLLRCSVGYLSFKDLCQGSVMTRLLKK